MQRLELLRMASWPRPSAPALPAAQLYTTMDETAATPLSGGLHVTSMGTILQAAATTDDGGCRHCSCPSGGSCLSAYRVHLGEHGKRMERKAADLQAASSLIEGLPSMRSIARSMREKSERLRQRTFTIALFGAFSAGKSSFANALIGERVLPVSPNPTTAAINKIMPPQEGWPHGTAKVKMKKTDAIMQDVLYSLDILGVQATDMASALKRITCTFSSGRYSQGEAALFLLEGSREGLGVSARSFRHRTKNFQGRVPKLCRGRI